MLLCFSKHTNTSSYLVLLQLAGAWTHLAQLVRRRRQVVDWGVKEQQYMFDAAEVSFYLSLCYP